MSTASDDRTPRNRQRPVAVATPAATAEASPKHGGVGQSDVAGLSSPWFDFFRVGGTRPPGMDVWEVSDSYAADIDRAFKANLARLTLGLSPAGIVSKYFEWYLHLVLSPGKQLQLVSKAGRKSARLMNYAANSSRDPATPACIEPLPQDRRFNHESWKTWPFNLYYQSFLLSQQWWHNATTNVDGISNRDEQAIAFVTRQIIDHFSPSNFFWTNPEVMKATQAENGANLVRGYEKLLDDWKRSVSGDPPDGMEKFVVGRDLATTPGKVIYRNRLIELIQYAPTTGEVHPEPTLIVPAWIMKYYILDLSQQNSLIRYLVGRGFTVFAISWRNPDADDRDLGMEAYLEFGVKSALRAVNTVLPGRKVHATGYCLGGTLLSIASAELARDRDDTLQTMTLLAAQTDFSDAGELMMLVRESGLSLLESMMSEQGYLDAKQMSGAFQILRSTDLLWSRLVREYMLGERPQMIDMMAWNADATRMPSRMHSEYLRRLYLDNELARGQYRVGQRAVTLRDVSTPIFAVGTTTDHIAPWQSVHKIHLLTEADVTFVLTNGGHNAGIVSEPGRRGRRFQIATQRGQDPYVGPEQWVQQTPTTQGSWWPAWAEWLAARSQPKTAPPPMGATELPPLADAPGTYVLQR